MRRDGGIFIFLRLPITAKHKTKKVSRSFALAYRSRHSPEDNSIDGSIPYLGAHIVLSQSAKPTKQYRFSGAREVNGHESHSNRIEKGRA